MGSEYFKWEWLGVVALRNLEEEMASVEGRNDCYMSKF